MYILVRLTRSSSGMSLLIPLAMSLKDLNADEVSRREVYPERAPAGPTPPADG